MTGKELKQKLRDSGLAMAEVARRLGMSPQHLNQALNVADVKMGFVARVADVTGVGLPALMGVDVASAAVETRPRIPSTVAAGMAAGFADGIALHQCEQVPVVKAFPPYDFTMIVQGNSMEPKFEGGDEIAIRRVSDVIEWGKTYVLDTRDGAILKRIYDAGGSFRCVSYNSEYPDFEVAKSDVFGVYRVVGLLRL